MFLHQNIYEHNMSKSNYLGVDEKKRCYFSA